MTMKRYYLLALGATVLTVLFLAYGITALGIIGAGGRPDRLYLGVFGVVLVGTLVARLRPAGMTLTALGAAATCGIVAVVALALGYADEPGASAVEILGLNAMYGGMFCVAAWLFRRSAVEPSAAAH
jgi:hypothetical protein